MKVYIDGRYYDKEDAKISVYDHGLLYGDGIFEGIRIYNGKIFKLSEHVKRLFQSARAISLEIPLSEEELKEAISDTVGMNDLKDGYIRLVITRGIGNLGINPITCQRPSIIIIVDKIQLYPEEYYSKGIKIMTSSVRRISSDSLDPRIKSLNYLNNIMAKIEANNANCFEAVMLNREGFVAECTVDNIFIIKDGTLQTPKSRNGALDGITKNAVLELAKNMGLHIEERTLTQYDLYNSDECFFSGTGAEIMPVIQIDGRKIGTGIPGPVTMKLVEGFKKALLN
jgi:branched-chain amino acid aminotransferase